MTKEPITLRNRIDAIRLRRLAVFILEAPEIDRDWLAERIRNVAYSIDSDYWTRKETAEETANVERLA